LFLEEYGFASTSFEADDAMMVRIVIKENSPAIIFSIYLRFYLVKEENQFHG
jgi:hypothetical protein